MVKCPKKQFKKSMNEAVKKLSFWTGCFSERRVNTKSHWYIEIQAQLHISKRKMAYLVIYLGGTVYEIIEVGRNDEFWKKEMEKELVFFFNEALLKELVDPRDDRGMDLRKYSSEKDTFE